MASTINAITTGAGGIVTTGDSSGIIALQSNGTTIATFATTGVSGVSNLVSWSSTVQTSGFTAAAGNGYFCNTTSAGFTVTLPASPNVNDQIGIIDFAGTFATNNLTISSNGNKINGSTASATLSTSREGLVLVYSGSTQGWLTVASTTVSGSATPQTYTGTYLVVAGGGGGGTNVGGGGGAGGYLTGTVTLNAGTVYTASIGGGGAAAGSGTASSFTGSPISPVSATGGGAGGNYPAASPGQPGGSGGGGAGNSTAYPGGSGTPGQGNAGGAGTNNPLGSNFGGGGGGASAAGSQNSPNPTGAASPGGAGTAKIGRAHV